MQDVVSSNEISGFAEAFVGVDRVWCEITVEAIHKEKQVTGLDTTKEGESSLTNVENGGQVVLQVNRKTNDLIWAELTVIELR